MASPTQWIWIWVNSGSWWWTGRPGMLQSMGLQRVRHDWATELNRIWEKDVLYTGTRGLEVKVKARIFGFVSGAQICGINKIYSKFQDSVFREIRKGFKMWTPRREERENKKDTSTVRPFYLYQNFLEPSYLWFYLCLTFEKTVTLCKMIWPSLG